MISIIANGVYYRSLVAFSKQNKLSYTKLKQKFEECESFSMFGFRIKIATQRDLDLIAKGKMIKEDQESDIPISRVVDDPVPKAVDGKRPALLSRVETVGIGKTWQ